MKKKEILFNVQYIKYNIIIVKKNTILSFDLDYDNRKNIIIILEENAQLFLYKRIEHNITISIVQEKNSQLYSYIINRKYIKIYCHIIEENCITKFLGSYIAKYNEKITTNINIFHHAKCGISNILFKGISFNNGVNYFTSNIFIDKGSKNTVAMQLNKNILFDKESIIISKPNLNILEKNVICNHGTTIDNIDKKIIFYLSSRGIEINTAKKMFIKAFLYDPFIKINDRKMNNIFFQYIMDNTL